MDRIESPAVYINRDDARKLNITDNTFVEVWNDRGKIRVKAAVSDTIIPGVLAMSQGAWYSPDTHKTDIRGSVNVLTTSVPTPLAKGNPQHSNLVNIRSVTS
jgi:anaerobic dimethyl sulfoxide reductase subunit A